MSKARLRLAWFITASTCLLACGCVDAVRDGVTEGVSGGISSLIESCSTWITDLVFGNA